MEEKFLFALEDARQKAEKLGVRIRPVLDMKSAHRILSGHRESDGFTALADKGRLELSLEAFAVKKQFPSQLSRDEIRRRAAEEALSLLLEEGKALAGVTL